MLKCIQNISVMGIVIILSMIVVSCEKKVSHDKLVERNGITYEVNSQEPFSGSSVEYHNDGKTMLKSIHFKDGLKDGVSNEWHENGQMKMELIFKTGQASGTSYSWYKNSQVRSEGIWENGKLNGIYKLWHENGNLRAEKSYTNDQLQGNQKTWYENGQQASEGTFTENTLDGIFLEWHQNGTKMTEGNYLKGHKVGSWSYWNKDGIAVVIDIDGNEYKTVPIGDQVWMKENLKVTHFRNGDPISRENSDYFWKYVYDAKYCSYKNSEDELAEFGALYNWYAVSDSRNIAPEGWHVPTDDEWKQLEIILGMNLAEVNTSETIGRGTDIGAKLKSLDIWSNDDNGISNGTNESGFSALPAGMRSAQDGKFHFKEFAGYFWCASEAGRNYAWYRSLTNWYTNINRDYGDLGAGMSVRCVKD